MQGNAEFACRVEAEGRFENKPQTFGEGGEDDDVEVEGEEVGDGVENGSESADEAVRLADRIHSGLDTKAFPRNRKAELGASLHQMKERFRKAKSSYDSKKGAKPRKRKSKITTEKESWTDCFFPCPCCGDQLKAWTTGVEPKHKVKVESLAV